MRSKKLEFSAQDTLVVDDAANELSMYAYADTRISFCANTQQNNHASHIMAEQDVTQVSELAP